MGREAHLEYVHQMPYLMRRETPPPRASNGYTVGEVVDLFINEKQAQRDKGKLAARSYDHYFRVGAAVMGHLGENASADIGEGYFESLRDEMESRLGAEALNADMNVVMSMFRLGHKRGIVSRLVNFSECFPLPTAKDLRAARELAGERLMTPDEILAIVKAAPPYTAAMVLLGINGGLGNSDVAELTITTFRKEPGWLNYPRHKTAVGRRIPLWDETTVAIEKAIATRIEPKHADDKDVLFINRKRQSFRDEYHGHKVSRAFARSAEDAGVKGRSFYDLRRTFQTVADESLDFVAVSRIMGHAPQSRDMPSRYRRKIIDQRLIAAVNTVHDWLYKRNRSNSNTKAGRK